MKAEVILRSQSRRNAEWKCKKEINDNWEFTEPVNSNSLFVEPVQGKSVLVEPVNAEPPPIEIKLAEEACPSSEFMGHHRAIHRSEEQSVISNDSHHEATPLVSRPPIIMEHQSVIRPVPLLPMDTSIYSSPPTYIDSLPPTISPPGLPGMLHGNRAHFIENSWSQTSCRSSQDANRMFNSVQSSCEMYECRWLSCECQFASMEELVTHVNDHHVRVERSDSEYQCKWGGCPRRGKGFNARYKMLIHIRTHTNEKPHKCRLCGKSFSRLENLKIHMRSHTGEKPYMCPFEGCNKAYSNSSDRFKHVRTHQEDKPYICKMPGCNKRYTDPSSLRKHVRTHGHYVKEGSCSMSPEPLQTHSSIIDISRSFTSSVKPFSPTNMKVPLSLFTTATETSVIHLTGLHANPLLSSAIIPMNKYFLTSQHELTSLDVRSPSSALATRVEHSDSKSDNDKSQDSPLDLSTNPSSPLMIFTHDAENGRLSTSHVSRYEGLAQDIVRWEIIHMAT
ncbi:zinc finger protein GLIS2-like [Dreissena polymorpha]|uniref:C2H2-type domain-containing protein n=1 Tax=Dreissena polymorpha TaxID=45954 RepID=A0A9D4K662_DREPO|nr:zinc finger protein GLIS2-like [Dreissena polymorpha]XP_052281956.1 zinc finger protein GLIS2-like [Dreissena polymorpha]KAH3833810.1 hypothetical protein DPMN_107126 [Dreissena polymorpha]